jgi:hypothetical protein
MMLARERPTFPHDRAWGHIAGCLVDQTEARSTRLSCLHRKWSNGALRQAQLAYLCRMKLSHDGAWVRGRDSRKGAHKGLRQQLIPGSDGKLPPLHDVRMKLESNLHKPSASGQALRLTCPLLRHSAFFAGASPAVLRSVQVHRWRAAGEGRPRASPLSAAHRRQSAHHEAAAGASRKRRVRALWLGRPQPRSSST